MPKNFSRLCALATASLCASLLVAPAAQAQEFPTRAVRLVVPFPPGGATDALARQIAEKLSQQWKQPVLVENKPGANTMLGTDVVAKAAADGHTLGIVTGSHVINPLLASKMPYDTLKDLTGVMMLTRFHMALYANPSFPANNPAELIELAKKNPGKIAYGSATTQSYLGMELLNEMAGTKMQYVPYKGSAQALTDVLGGHLQLMIDPVLQSTLDHSKTGKLKVIATLAAQPSALTPGVALMASAVKGFDYSGVFGLVTRAGTPPALVRRIRDDFAGVLKQPDVAARIRDIGQEPIGSTPEEYNAYIQAEMKKWEPVVKSTGAKLD
ncbi:MAG: tripartite tricarboxylate transporter substrate binding protein [Ramlibacter sp.]|jgi:tripartite-type tricarboxylate transporter receptor subunit TctC|nr:tripartite tricarboxylate transporter substrate binding protein [Ramlibacter sp.]